MCRHDVLGRYCGDELRLEKEPVQLRLEVREILLFQNDATSEEAVRYDIFIMMRQSLASPSFVSR